MKSLTIENITSSLTSSPEILGKDKYLNSAVLIPLFEKDDELHVLFEKRANNIRQGGEVSFPGGEFDSLKDKSLRTTAVRETSEELGIETNSIKVLGNLGTLVAPMGVTVDAFVGIISISDITRLPYDRIEVDRLFSFPLEYFLNTKPDEYYVKLEVHPNELDENGKVRDLLPVAELGLPERYAKPWRKGLHRILVYKTSEEVIWGITAEIIFEFAKLIGKNK